MPAGALFDLIFFGAVENWQGTCMLAHFRKQGNFFSMDCDLSA